jgi:glycosyltransferase involved in cell wall biosynthesis
LIRGFDDAVPNRDFLLAFDSDDFVDKLVSVLFDDELSKKLGENARKISLRYDWTNLSKEVFNVLESVVKRR